jgi:L-histidine Nalpha-methyltransferase
MIMTQLLPLPAVDRAPPTSVMARDVLRGLATRPKHLPSRYLYDARGAGLFERICELDEYYLTSAELGILDAALPEIANAIGPRAMILEPGSGSGRKTRRLLGALDSPAAYVPVDLSREQLFAGAEALALEFPSLDVRPVCADFMGDFLDPPISRPVERHVAYFPGSTIGNLSPREAAQLLRHLRLRCGSDGLLIVGADLQKDPAILERAYNDSKGLSAAFALNYLVRLNRELDADFSLAHFSYRATYNAALGRIEMYLVSRRQQVVLVAGEPVEFDAGEPICTEVSYKYSAKSFAELAASSFLVVRQTWTDSRGYFAVYLLSSL